MWTYWNALILDFFLLNLESTLLDLEVTANIKSAKLKSSGPAVRFRRTTSNSEPHLIQNTVVLRQNVIKP